MEVRYLTDGTEGNDLSGFKEVSEATLSFFEALDVIKYSGIHEGFEVSEVSKVIDASKSSEVFGVLEVSEVS